MKRLSRLRLYLITIFGTSGIVLLCLLGAYFYILHEFDQPGPLLSSKIVTIAPGNGTTNIADKLYSFGIIFDPKIFVAGVWINGLSGSLQAGEYNFNKGISPSDVMKKISQGDVFTRKITFHEGITNDGVVSKINSYDTLVGNIYEMPLEGSLLPDTYIYRRGESRQSIIDRMQVAMQRFLNKTWESRSDNLPYRRPEDAVTMASIIEMEAGMESERAIISGVFINRLRLKMPLQSDPTVMYSITGGVGKLERSLTRDDLAIQSPFNTYKIKGLPPHPISNPGRASLLAALNPASTELLYFVANGKGGHRFAKSLKEHNKNVELWRQMKK